MEQIILLGWIVYGVMGMLILSEYNYLLPWKINLFAPINRWSSAIIIIQQQDTIGKRDVGTN